MHKTDVLIIGAGPVGLFAIFEAGMLSMKCHVVDSLDEIGGQCSALYPEKPIYDIPAYPKILANELIEKLSMQAKPFEPVYHLSQQVVSFEAIDNKFVVKTDKNTIFETKIIIIAAGAGAFGPNRPPLEDIEKYEGKSVFYYVKKMQDFAGKRIAIAGGGDSAVDWAINLSDFAEKIFLIHRRDKFRASPASLQRISEISATGKIEIITPYQLHSLEGSDGNLSSVKLYDLENNIKSLDANILLPFFGLSMDLGGIKDWGLSFKTNHIEVSQSSCMTNIDGIYAIGDVATYSGKLKLILTGFAEAASALHHAYSRVFDGKALHFEYSTSKQVEGLK
jgi:thioredoxin reductase (NADPH)